MEVKFEIGRNKLNSAFLKGGKAPIGNGKNRLVIVCIGSLIDIFDLPVFDEGFIKCTKIDYIYIKATKRRHKGSLKLILNKKNNRGMMLQCLHGCIIEGVLMRIPLYLGTYNTIKHLFPTGTCYISVTYTEKE